MRYAVVDQKTWQVINVIVLDPSAVWSPPSGTVAIPYHEAAIGDLYDIDKEIFYKPIIENTDTV